VNQICVKCDSSRIKKLKMPKSSKMASSNLPAKKRKRDSGLNGELDKSKDDKGLGCPPVKKRKKDNSVPPSVKKNGDNSVKKIGDSFKVNGVKGEEGGEKADSCVSLTCDPCNKQFSSNTTFKYHEYFCQRTAPSEDRDKIEALLKKSKDIIEARNKAATKLVNGDASEGAASGKEAKSLKGKSLINHKLPLTPSESTKNACELTNGSNGVLVPSDEAFKKPAAETKPEFSILPSRRPERRKSVVNRFLCLLCTDKFASKADKLRHTKQVHEMEKKFPCGFCDLRFSLEIRLRRHLKVHLPD